MNVKPGDLAIVIRGRAVAGRVVEIVGPCPRNVVFLLPDGCGHEPVDYEWIVRFQNPVEAPMDNGRSRTALYAPMPERVLRPISGVPVTDDVTDEVTA
ncbi:hypothetical protein [Burkholderia cepacia]|uniref:hypothetical protein n=1 Tax=Burkholderia cepacia TaxID=292 RepID=UPI001F24B14A|nr:hypothetical protein [Burkholderia cepacia]MCE4125395.1 hypothetical protein [Burkholderia cepacia]